MDMLLCQGAQNIGLSNHKLKSALQCTAWSQWTPVTDGRTDGRTDRQTDRLTDEHHGNSVTTRSMSASHAKKVTAGEHILEVKTRHNMKVW